MMIIIIKRILFIQPLNQLCPLMARDMMSNFLRQFHLSFQLNRNTSARIENMDMHVFWFSHHSKFFKSASKPKEKSRSASSTTSISRDECRTRFWALRCASTRDGVPTITSGFSIRMDLLKDDVLSVAVYNKRQCCILYNPRMSWPLRWQVCLPRDVGHPDVPWAVRR